MFGRFTDDARQVIVKSHAESQLLGQDHIGTEHLLLGLLADEDGDVARALSEVGVTRASARDTVRSAQPRATRPELSAPPDHLPFTPNAKHLLEHSLGIADRLGHERIAPAHLLGALLTIRDGGGTRALADEGVDLDDLALVADQIAERTAGE